MDVTDSQRAVLRMLSNGSRTDGEIAEEWGRMSARCADARPYALSTLRNARVALMKQYRVIDTGRQRNRAAVWALKGPRHLGVLSRLRRNAEEYIAYMAAHYALDYSRDIEREPRHRAVS